jgi:hypothetical protein
VTATERAQQEIEQLSNERYGKPLEHDHPGRFIAVARDGRTVPGATRFEAARKTQEELGSGMFLYKLGERSVGEWP